MKQFIYSAGLFFVASFGSLAQTVVFEENFDSGIPLSFTLHNQDGYTPHSSVSEYTEAWMSKEDPTDASNTVASATSYFSPVGMADRWLVTPAITLSSFGNYLSWSGKSHDASFSESYLVLISTTGTSVENFTDTLKAVVNESTYWTNHTVSLSDAGYDDETVYIAFALRTVDGFKFYMDSLKVVGEDPLNTNNLTNISDFKLYPNPATDNIFFQSEFPVQHAIIRDVNGTVVLKTEESNIAIQHLSSGIYFLELVHSNGVSSRRFVKI